MNIALAINVQDGIDVGRLVDETCDELHMAHKECWLICQMDGASWSRALSGQAPLDLWKLRLLGITWWQHFIPKLASALIQHWMRDLQVPYRMVKAELPEKQERKAQ